MSKTARGSARQGIRPRVERWAKMLDRYCIKEYFDIGERDDARVLADRLRSLSGRM